MYIMEDEVRSLAPTLLLGSELVRDGYLEGTAVRRLVEEHLAHQRDHGSRIWLLLSAEVWYRRYVRGRSTPDLEAEIAERRPRVLERAG
jgi:hypothetical protein